MTQSKHTPGPWFTTAKTTDDIGDVRFTASNGKTYQIARAFSGESDNCAANAKLIAAAPELLNTLKDALLFADQYLTDAGKTCGFFKRGLELITKAEGGAE